MAPQTGPSQSRFSGSQGGRGRGRESIAGDLELQTALGPFAIELISLETAGSTGVVDFDPTRDYDLKIVEAGLLKFFDPLNPTRIAVDTTDFENDLQGGTWGVRINDPIAPTELFLTFTAAPVSGGVPEPVSATLSLLGLAALGWSTRRRR